MARPGITFLDVKDAIAELQGREKNITVDHIREVLGTGSRSTINNHLKTWRSQACDAGLNDPTLPSELISLIKGLWENMRNKANDTITQHQAQCDDKVEAVEIKFENIKQALANSEKQNLETTALLQQKSDQADQLQTKLALEQQETNKLNERIISLETRHQDTVDENKKLHEHIKHLQTNLEHYQATIQKQQQAQSLEIEKTRHACDQKVKILKQENESLHISNIKLTTEKEGLEQQYATLKKDHNRLSATLSNTEKKLTQTTVKYETLVPKHQALEIQLKEREEALLSKRLEAERLQVEFSTQKTQLNQNAKQLQKALTLYEKLLADCNNRPTKKKDQAGNHQE